MNYLYNICSKSSVLVRLYKNSVFSKSLHRINRLFIYVYRKKNTFVEYFETIHRRLGFQDKRFVRLQRLQNKYKGKRCFITCTGPSLTIKDLECLKDEYVFGMNSICLIHDKTDWKPDFFGIQDWNVYKRIKDTLLKTDNGVIFAPYKFKKSYKTPDNWIYFHMSGSYHLYEMGYKTRYFAKFSDDCYNTVYDGYSITYSIIQLAIYMGFDELYLLGADCSYIGNRQHFIEHGNSNPAFEAGATERLYASYGEAKSYAEKNNIKIINATRGGCLELFPRESLEDVLARDEKNKKS